MTTTYLYIFGKVGGPFKVGYSKHPERRAKAIPRVYPGSDHSLGLAMMWETFPLPDLRSAKRAERVAHRKLRPYQILAKDSGEGWRQEWFCASLPRVRRAVARIAARHAGTTFRLGVTRRQLDLVDRWRMKQPDLPTREVAIVRIVTETMDRGGVP